MAAEAYMRRDGGMSTDALRCYNKTWERAGNDKFAGPLTQDILLDEYARELNFEGVRWPLLKRLGPVSYTHLFYVIRKDVYGWDRQAPDFIYLIRRQILLWDTERNRDWKMDL